MLEESNQMSVTGRCRSVNDMLDTSD